MNGRAKACWSWSTEGVGELTTFISFLVVVGLVVLFHEFGHFMAAKFSGMRVRQFALGFGRAIVSVKRQQTTYRLNIVPLGGYVDIAGLEPEDEDAPDGFHSKPIWQRWIVLLSGGFMNIVLAVLVFWLIGFAFGVDEKVKPEVGNLVEELGAVKAGMQPNDLIVAAEGKKVRSAADVREVVEDNPDKVVKITVRRGSEEKTLEVETKTQIQRFATLSPAPDDKILASMTSPIWDDEGIHWQKEYVVERKVAMIGVVFKGLRRRVGFAESVIGGLRHTFNTTATILIIFKQMLTGRASLKDVAAGPVGIAKIVGQAAERGTETFLFLLAMISINVAIINLLPLPALDGGRLAFLGLETVRRKPIDRRKEAYIHFAGMILILLFILYITYQDILKWLE